MLFDCLIRPARGKKKIEICTETVTNSLEPKKEIWSIFKLLWTTRILAFQGLYIITLSGTKSLLSPPNLEISDNGMCGFPVTPDHAADLSATTTLIHSTASRPRFPMQVNNVLTSCTGRRASDLGIPIIVKFQVEITNWIQKEFFTIQIFPSPARAKSLTFEQNIEYSAKPD